MVKLDCNNANFLFEIDIMFHSKVTLYHLYMVLFIIEISERTMFVI